MKSFTRKDYRLFSKYLFSIENVVLPFKLLLVLEGFYGYLIRQNNCKIYITHGKKQDVFISDF